MTHADHYSMRSSIPTPVRVSVHEPTSLYAPRRPTKSLVPSAQRRRTTANDIPIHASAPANDNSATVGHERPQHQLLGLLARHPAAARTSSSQCMRRSKRTTLTRMAYLFFFRSCFCSALRLGNCQRVGRLSASDAWSTDRTSGGKVRGATYEHDAAHVRMGQERVEHLLQVHEHVRLHVLDALLHAVWRYYMARVCTTQPPSQSAVLPAARAPESPQGDSRNWIQSA